MSLNAEELRDPERLVHNVRAAWRSVSPGDEDDNPGAHVYRSLKEDYRLTRVGVDAKPGTVCYDDRDSPVLTRKRYEMDPSTFELKLVETKSRRYDPVDDVNFNSAAQAQFRELRRGLRTLTRAGLPKFLRDGGEGTVAMDATITKAIVTKYGTEDLIRLRRALFMSEAAAKTVSRFAAVDAMDDLFLAGELVIQSPDIVELEKRRPFIRELIPMRNLNALGATSYEISTIEKSGRAEFVSNLGGRAPTATIKRKSMRRPLYLMRSGMMWDLMDLERWKQARSSGAPLPDFVSEQRDAAREALLELESYTLLFGHDDLDIIGLLDSKNGIPQPAAISNFADAASGEEAVQKLLTGANAIFSTNKEIPELIGLGTRDYLYVTQTAYEPTSGDGRSIAQVALDRGKDLGLKAIVRVPEFGRNEEVKTYLIEVGYDDTTAEKYAGGVGGKDVMVTWSKNQAKLRGVTGIDLRQLPPDRTSTETSVQMIMSTGGVEVRFPKAAHIQKINAPT
jgi:hypothetical protein